ncbi:LysR substrate-binding domain-containing protein [Glaciimonas sp. PAMC28666]|uniref:LysR substrate-binding domain-containing protein n=1 Tax=Glaciimonas sp. PAMC28666 TaxID=2807626 RepID=UPI0019654905|nr:LysR substrate-binding domain-containing protein [Glaciimonas sp. PAMC28666]QRX83707.1 LysR family transcriptional regulator [Glaciimonas sp. PAMC28666]
MNFHQLRCFHAVALHGSFTAAARALFVGQPSITTHVKALEQRFGVELFSRHGHIVELTDTGQRLLSITHRIFTLETEAEETLRAAGGLLEGRIRIAAFDPVQVTQMVVAFGKRYPEVRVSVAFGNSGELSGSLLELQADVAVLPRLGDKRFYSVPYRRAKIALLVGAGHPWFERSDIRVEELEGQRIVTRESGSMQQKVFDDYLTECGVSVRRVLEIDSQDAIREAIAAGVGVGIALDVIYPDARLRRLTIAEAPMFIDLELACLAERREAPVIKAFFEVVQDLRNDLDCITNQENGIRKT